MGMDRQLLAGLFTGFVFVAHFPSMFGCNKQLGAFLKKNVVKTMKFKQRKKGQKETDKTIVVNPGICRACFGAAWWRLLPDGGWICMVCHPPAVSENICFFEFDKTKENDDG